MPVIQNITVPAGDTVELTFNLDDDALALLEGAMIRWKVYEQQFGVALSDTDPVIQKSEEDGITVPGSPPDIFTVALAGTDTQSLLHNYYHEAFIQDTNGNKFTVTVGVFTVTPTKIASAS